MSMSMVVGELKTNQNNQLDADYKELSNKIIITEYMDEVVTEFLDEIKVYEEVDENEYGEIIYKTFFSLNLEKMSEKIDELSSKLFQDFYDIKGKKEQRVIVEKLENLNKIDYLLKKMLIEKSKDTSNKEILILII